MGLYDQVLDVLRGRAAEDIISRYRKHISPFDLNDNAWASVPRMLYDWNPAGAGGALGSGGIVFNGAYQVFASSWSLWRGATALPAVRGFRREYRTSHQIYYNSLAVGATTANWTLAFVAVALGLITDPGAPYNAARDVSVVGPWMTQNTVGVTDLENLPDGHYFVNILGNFAVAAPTCYLRQITIEGRYVRT